MGPAIRRPAIRILDLFARLIRPMLPMGFPPRRVYSRTATDGFYQNEVRLDWAGVTGSVGEQGYGTVGMPFRPDGMIGKSVSQKKGDNIYVMGTSQEYRQVSKRLKRLRWYLRIENDGETEDTFSSSLTRKNGFFNAQLFDHVTRANVTALANLGGLTARVSGGQSKIYRLDVKPTRMARNKKKRKVFSFTNQSGNDPALSDGVRARAETKR